LNEPRKGWNVRGILIFEDLLFGGADELAKFFLRKVLIEARNPEPFANTLAEKVIVHRHAQTL